MGKIISPDMMQLTMQEAFRAGRGKFVILSEVNDRVREIVTKRLQDFCNENRCVLDLSIRKRVVTIRCFSVEWWPGRLG